MKRFISFVLLFCLCFHCVGCSDDIKSFEEICGIRKEAADRIEIGTLSKKLVFTDRETMDAIYEIFDTDYQVIPDPEGREGFSYVINIYKGNKIYQFFSTGPSGFFSKNRLYIAQTELDLSLLESFDFSTGEDITAGTWT